MYYLLLGAIRPPHCWYFHLLLYYYGVDQFVVTQSNEVALTAATSDDKDYVEDVLR